MQQENIAFWRGASPAQVLNSCLEKIPLTTLRMRGIIREHYSDNHLPRVVDAPVSRLLEERACLFGHAKVVTSDGSRFSQEFKPRVLRRSGFFACLYKQTPSPDPKHLSAVFGPIVITILQNRLTTRQECAILPELKQTEGNERIARPTVCERWSKPSGWIGNSGTKLAAETLDRLPQMCDTTGVEANRTRNNHFLLSRFCTIDCAGRLADGEPGGSETSCNTRSRNA